MKEIYDFLRQLAQNNNREWFAANKGRYDSVRQKVHHLAELLILGVARYEPSAARLTVGDCTYRIYRDTRFSLDKTPYKTHIGIFINPPYGKKGLSGGWYLHLEPDNSFFAAGAGYLPSPYIKAIRKDIYDNIEEYLEIVENPEFRRLLPVYGDDLLKTAPAGYDKNWQYIHYLRPKNFFCEGPVDERLMTTPEAVAALMDDYFRVSAPLVKFYNFAIEQASLPMLPPPSSR